MWSATLSDDTLFDPEPVTPNLYDPIMGYVERRPDRPRPWRVRYRDPAGRERSRSFVRRTDADRFLHSVETDMVRGDWTDPRLGRLTFGDWSTSVEAGRVNVATSTRDNYRSVLRNLVLPTFGSVPVGAIEPGAIREWIADLVADGYSPSTIRRAYTLLREALELAVGDQMIPRSPCRNIALPKADRTEMRFLTINEVEALADAIRPRYRAFVLTGAYTGLRPGELAALRIDRLDILRRQLRVEEPIKTPAARRTVSFPPFLAEVLAAHVSAYPGKDGYVFTAPEGGRLGPSLFRRRMWYPAVRASVGEPMRPHDLRHTQVALLIAAGEEPYVISKRLGHASIRTTYDIYGHLFEGRDREAADALETARTEAVAAQVRPKGGPAITQLHP